MRLRIGVRWVVVLAVYAPMCLATVKGGLPGAHRQWEMERAVWLASFHHAGPGTVPRREAATRCENTRPAEALATPDPLLDKADVRGKIAVSFIIGTDGRVHSAVVLEGAGSNQDSSVLEAVRAWRYRPAMCNAVPAETESRVEFSGR